MKQGKISRRDFMRGAAASAAVFTIVPRHVLGGPGNTPPSDKLNIAAVGAGGQAAGDINNVKSQNIVALCDVDHGRAGDTFKAFPQAKVYSDFRRMLERERGVDAVVVATPDHIHAPAAIMAMELGKHVYVEKPMAHTIYECRQMLAAARRNQVVTQMGNQGHAGEGLRLTYEYIKSGAIGEVREVHVWSDRAKGWWPQGVDRPSDTPAVPDNLDWDLWLGPAPYRPYNSAYVPFKWRGWLDYGCGAMGDMAVHNADPAFFCLDLGAPEAVAAETSKVNNETFPEWSIIHYYFPARGNLPPVKMTWYDGGKLPKEPPEMEGLKFRDNGIYFVGSKGGILCGSHAGTPVIKPESLRKATPKPQQMLERSVGHHAEWIDACKANDPKMAKAGFEYSAPFTEALLVGNLAVRLQRRIRWDAAHMKAVNEPEADILINKKYRDGFRV
ncbi:MAG: Gfo/Idh/MocA family oxidoreductase [Sedimentisphaerales bacterium]|nr:Gfo/Idh/MocA family oxidoreductase [Sedimentisphaerales bacterium]